MSSHSDWSQREEAIWSYLRAQPRYQALGLQEYPGHQGCLIPFEPRLGLASSAQIPAIYSQPPAVRGSLTGAGVIDSIEVPFGIITQHSGGPSASGNALAPGRSGIDEAAITLRDLLTDIDARSSRFGASSVISDVAFTPIGITAVPMAGGEPGSVAYWHFQFSLTIEGVTRPRNR